LQLKKATPPIFVPLPVRVEAQQKAALGRAAKEDGRSLSSLVQIILADWLKGRSAQRLIWK
jgi:hypothetical protein